MSCGPWWACPSRELPRRPCCAWWGYHRCSVQMLTPGSPSPTCWSGCLSQWCCAVTAASCNCRGCGASFSVGLFLEENLFLSFLTVGLWKTQSSAYHPAALCLLGWELGSVGPLQMWVPTADAGNPPPGTSLRHATALCSPVGKAPLPHTLVKKRTACGTKRKKSMHFCLSTVKCILLLWVALLTP